MSTGKEVGSIHTGNVKGRTVVVSGESTQI